MGTQTDMIDWEEFVFASQTHAARREGSLDKNGAYKSPSKIDSVYLNPATKYYKQTTSLKSY